MIWAWVLNSWLESKTCTLVAGLIHSWNCCRCTASPLDSSRLLSVCARVYERVRARACLRGSDKHATPSPQNLNDLMSVFQSTCVTKCVFFCAGLTFKFLCFASSLTNCIKRWKIACQQHLLWEIDWVHFRALHVWQVHFFFHAALQAKVLLEKTGGEIQESKKNPQKPFNGASLNQTPSDASALCCSVIIR